MGRTTFNNPDPGDVIVDSDVDQFISPVNKLEDGTPFWAADSASGTDNYVVTLDPPVTSYTAGLFLHFSPNTNNTGVATINLNGVGSNIIKKGDGTVDLEDDDLVADNIYLLVYNGSNFVLVSGGSAGGSGTANLITISGENGEAFTVKKGQPVKLFGSGSPPVFKLAQANDIANACFGIAATDVATGATFNVILLGALINSDWTDVIGSTNLTFNQEYFLGQGTAGVLDSSPPTGSGDIIQSIGKATSTTELIVKINDFYVL